jgi:hypothetical protein
MTIEVLHFGHSTLAQVGRVQVLGHLLAGGRKKFGFDLGKGTERTYGTVFGRKLEGR